MGDSWEAIPLKVVIEVANLGLTAAPTVGPVDRSAIIPASAKVTFLATQPCIAEYPSIKVHSLGGCNLLEVTTNPILPHSMIVISTSY